MWVKDKLKIWDVARPEISIQYSNNGWESSGVVLAHASKQFPQFPEEDIKLNIFDNWHGFTPDTNPALHQLMRRRGQHAIFGPPGLTGLW